MSSDQGNGGVNDDARERESLPTAPEAADEQETESTHTPDATVPGEDEITPDEDVTSSEEAAPDEDVNADEGSALSKDETPDEDTTEPNEDVAEPSEHAAALEQATSDEDATADEGAAPEEDETLDEEATEPNEEAIGLDWNVVPHEDAVPGEDAPAQAEEPPTITGLFNVQEVADERDDEDEEPRAEEPAVETDSIRLIGELFGGFRRKSKTSQQDLHRALGASTQTLPAIVGGRVVPTSDASEAVNADEATEHEEIPAAAETLDADEASGETTPANDDLAPENDTTDDEAIAEEPAADEVPPATPIDDAIAVPLPTTDAIPPQQDDVQVNDSQQDQPQQPPVIKTAYVPQSSDNETERALAWLTAENVRPGQMPAASQLADIVPRRRRWVGAIFAPIITAIVLAVAYVVTFAVWPLTNVAPTVEASTLETPIGQPADIPWPEQGGAAIAIEGFDHPITSPQGQDPQPMASLTKVITVLVLLERQPLELGEDGREYEFGWLDQQAANDLRWINNETALDVPVGGTLTYHQLLQGILIESAGNYANKLVDQMWDGDRDAFAISALNWLERHGIYDTVIVDPSGINPENTSTPADMLKVSELALQNPVVAEIVSTRSAVIPGIDTIENSNGLLGEEGILGIKTGTLDTWDHTAYNLTVAKDIDLGDEEPTRVYSAVMGQQDREQREGVSRQILAAVEQALQPTEALPEGTVVATVTAPWGARTQVMTSRNAELTLFDGEEAEIDLDDFTVGVGSWPDRAVGTMTVSGELDQTEVELRTTDAFEAPSFTWRLTHPLELLGFAD